VATAKFLWIQLSYNFIPKHFGLWSNSGRRFFG